MPTDTVYGIGCLMVEKSIKKLYKIKNRPLTQPTAVLMTEKQLCLYSRYSNFGGIIDKIILKKFFAGKMTVVFPIKYFNIKFPKMITKDETIGIRLPQYPWLEKLIDLVGPIVASSANKKGEIAPNSFNDIKKDLIAKVNLAIKTDLILDRRPSIVYNIISGEIIRS